VYKRKGVFINVRTPTRFAIDRRWEKLGEFIQRAPRRGVTFWLVMTPEDGALMSMIAVGLFISAPSMRQALSGIFYRDLGLGVGGLAPLPGPSGATAPRSYSSLERSNCACAVSRPRRRSGNRKKACEMSALWTRIRSWPLATVSPMRARNIDHWPEASEITGMLRRDVRANRAGHIHSGAASYFQHSLWKPLGMIHLEDIYVLLVFDDRCGGGPPI